MSLLLLTLPNFSAWAKGRLPPRPQFQAWISYFRGPEGFQDWRSAKTGLNEISVFTLQFDEKSRVIAATSPWVVDALNQLKTERPPIQLWLTMTNDLRRGAINILKDPQVVHEKLATPDTRSSLIEELLPWTRFADGLDIDYENVRKEDSEAFSLFIEELAKRLHAQHKKLSVTVQPKTDDQLGDNGRALDWRRIGAAADQVRVMAYFYHSSRGAPGSIAPFKWLLPMARFAKQEIPEKKLAFILTVNGLDWGGTSPAKSIRFSDVALILAAQGATPERDREGTPHFRYTQSGDMHEVWYEDLVSLKGKINKLRREGIRLIGFWELGSGDPAFWNWLASSSYNSK